MRVDVIEGTSAFEALRENWDAIYAADPEAHYYLSHAWQKDWLEIFTTPWQVLGVRPDEEGADYVAFLSLRSRTFFVKSKGYSNDLIFGGDQFSDYNGILCRPEFEDQAIPALAKHIRSEMNWAEFRLDNWRQSDKRRRLLLDAFDKVKFKRKTVSTYIPEQDVDNDICPYIELPDDWDAYLASISSNNRQKARRMLRKVEDSEEYRITVADADTYARDLEALLDLWRIKWQPSKKDRTEAIISRNRDMLSRCAERGMLFLPTFWHGDKPVAALATIVDDVKKDFLFVITGRDETFDAIPSGFVLHAFSIRHAIAQGMKRYDFLRGNEPYKYLFGVKEHPINTVVLNTIGKRNLKGVIDPRPLSLMLSQAHELTEKKQWADADLAYRQLLEHHPDHPLALYRFARVLVTRGDAEAARDALERSVVADPSGDNAWYELSRAREAAGDLAGALEAARRVVELAPRNEQAANTVWRLEARLKPPEPANKPVLTPARPAGLDAIAAATQKRSGFNQAAFDPGPRVNLDPAVLPGGPLRR